jgi:hypothetical protein
MKRTRPSKREKRRPCGSFGDLEALLEQLGVSPLIELGNPLPAERYLPKSARVGRCPAAHNKALLDEEMPFATMAAMIDDNHNGR